MTRRAVARVVAVLALAVVAAFGAPPARSQPAEVRSAHWVLGSEGTEDEAAELSRVLEAAWPQLLQFFGAAPKLGKDERLRVRFFETAEAMKSAIAAAGGKAPDSGGYYCPVARTSYAFRQPSRWYTRTLLIHEAVHQFHLLGTGALARTAPVPWWQEGLAEHLSHHTWDGAALRLGVVPPVSLEDRPAKALDAAQRPDFAPEKIVDEPMDRPRSMHLVRFLATAEGPKAAARWKEVAKALDHGDNLSPREVWKGFPNAAAFRERFVAWLRTVQQPLVSEFVEWDSLAEGVVRGRSASVCACRTRGAAASIEAMVTPLDTAKPGRVGVVLEFSGPQDYVIGQIDGGTRVRVDRLAGGAWQTLHEGAVPGAAGAAPWRIAAVRDGGSVTFRIAGADVFSLASKAGPLGLCLDATAADFRGVTIR